jgi:phospholipase/carboxylesterase
MDRRRFLALGATATCGVLGGRGLAAAGQAQDAFIEVPYGETRLGISDNFRDGSLYVPKQYHPRTPMPLVMMLHGYSGAAASVRFAFTLAEEFGVIVIAPESRDVTWGQSVPGFDADVRYLGAAYRQVSEFLNVDRSHVALAGVSDGANYALAMGLAYGDTFNHMMIFAAGMFIPLRRQGKPRIFLAHGTRDIQMPIDRTARLFVPRLQAEEYDITYREYDGGHGAPREVQHEAFEWFVGKPAAPK